MIRSLQNPMQAWGLFYQSSIGRHPFYHLHFKYEHQAEYVMEWLDGIVRIPIEDRRIEERQINPGDSCPIAENVEDIISYFTNPSKSFIEFLRNKEALEGLPEREQIPLL